MDFFQRLFTTITDNTWLWSIIFGVSVVAVSFVIVEVSKKIFQEQLFYLADGKIRNTGERRLCGVVNRFV